MQTSHIRDNLAGMTLIATGVPVLDPQAADVADVVKAPTKRPDGKGVTQRPNTVLLRYRSRRFQRRAYHAAGRRRRGPASSGTRRIRSHAVGGFRRMTAGY